MPACVRAKHPVALELFHAVTQGWRLGEE